MFNSAISSSFVFRKALSADENSSAVSFSSLSPTPNKFLIIFGVQLGKIAIASFLKSISKRPPNQSTRAFIPSLIPPLIISITENESNHFAKSSNPNNSAIQEITFLIASGIIPSIVPMNVPIPFAIESTRPSPVPLNTEKRLSKIPVKKFITPFIALSIPLLISPIISIESK